MHRYPKVGEDVPAAVDVLKDLVAAGHLLILWAMRSGKELQDAEDWFRDRDIPLYGVQKDPYSGHGPVALKLTQTSTSTMLP